MGMMKQLAMISPIVAVGVVVFIGIYLWAKRCSLGHDWERLPLYLTSSNDTGSICILECRQCGRREIHHDPA